jgi:hypothetical protein
MIGFSRCNPPTPPNSAIVITSAIPMTAIGTNLQLTLTDRRYLEQICTEKVTTTFTPKITVDLQQVW